MEVSDTDHDYFGNTKLPRGVRFYPFDGELVLDFLKKKVYRRIIEENFIGELDVYAFDPEELPSQSVWKSRDRQWFFFSHIIRRNPNGGRATRTANNGYWKVTGNDRYVTANNRTVGVIKTLVFYRGRAPGERTDWVMHEYTLSKEEIQRCRATPDPYVLYKLYQKSGRGPKNGEQYGAPLFIDEEWFDEVEPVEAMQPANAIPSDDSITVSDQNQLVENDIEEIPGQIADHPIADQPGTSVATQVLNQMQVGLNTVLDQSHEDSFCIEQGAVSHTGGQHYVAQASSEITMLAASNMYSCDAPKVTTTTNTSEQDSSAMVEDFLEINDLLGLGPSFMEMDKASEPLHPQEVNGLDGPSLNMQVGQNTVLDQSLEDSFCIEQGAVSHTGGQHYVAQASSEITTLAAPNMYSCDAPKVTTTTNISEQDSSAMVEDFLEINDLLSLGPSFMEMDKASEPLHLQELNGLDGPDLYIHAARFLIDLGHGTLEDDTSHLNYDTSSISSELWTPEQSSSLLAASGYDRLAAGPPNSGGTEGEPQGSSLDQF